MTESCREKSAAEAFRLLHGWISVILIGLIVTVGCIAIYRIDRLMTFAYLLFSAGGMTGVLYAFCAKCTCRNACRHLFPGELTRFLPRHGSGPYTSADMAMTVIGFSPLLFPQYWFFGQKALLFLFWQLTAALVAEILLFVCRGCTNRHCPANRTKK